MKKTKEKPLSTPQKRIYAIHFSQGGSKTKTTVPVIFGKAKEQKASFKTGFSKVFTSRCVSVYVCVLSRKSHSNNYTIKIGKQKANQVEGMRAMAEDWNGKEKEKGSWQNRL